MAEHDLNKIVDNSGEVFNLRDNTKQPTADRVTSWSSTTSDTKYPSEKLVKDSLDAKAPNAPSEVTIATGDKPLIADSSDSNKAKRASITFDTGVTNTFLRRNGTFGRVLYADEGWGGVFRSSNSPLDVALMFSRNVLLGISPACVKVEYSTDGGTTWLDYGLTDSQKTKLFAQMDYGVRVYCGKNTHIQPGYTGTIAGTKDLTNDIIADQRLRITFASRPFENAGTTSRTGEWLIAHSIRRISILMSTQSASQGTHCKLYGRTMAQFVAGNDTWTEYGDFPIVGDSGWNSIPCNNAENESGFQFGAYDSSAYSFNEIRLEIWSTKLNANPASSQTGNLQICQVCAIADKVNTSTSKWTCMMRFGLPCTSLDLDNNYPIFNNGIKFTARKLKTNLARTADSTFDGSANQENIPVTGTLPLGNGGTGKTTAKAAEYNLTTGKSEISDTTSGDDRVVFELASPSESNGVTRGFRKLSTIWTWIKGLLSSENGVNISGSSTSCTGNAATATALASGGADRTKLDGIAAGAEVNVQSDWNQTTTTADDYIKNKPTTMPPSAHVHNTDANEVTANDAASELNVVTDTTEIVTTNTGGYTSSDKKLYRRPAGSKIWPWIKGKLTSDSGVDISGNAATASDAKSGSTLATTITGKLNTDGSNVAETWSDANINKVLKNLNTENQDFYSGDDFIASSHTDAGVKENKFTRRSSSKVLNWLFNNGQHSAQIGGDMKKFGWVMGDYAGNASLGGWHIAKTDISNSSGYGNCVFRALVVIDKFTERVTYNEYGYNENNFVGILDIYARMNSATVAVSNIKKIGRLTSFYPNATSSGSTGWAVFAKVNQSNYTIDWYIGRGGQSSLSVQDIFKYTKISIMPLQNNGSNTLYMDRVTSTIDFSTAPDDYWQMFKTPLLASTDYGKGSSSLPVYVTANANTFAPVDAQSTQGNFIRSLTAGSNIGASEYIAAAGASSGQWKYTFTQLLDWINGKNVMERSPASVGTINKRIQLGYGSYGNGKAGYCCYLVHFFFKEVAGTLIGKGVTVLVSYDWYGTTYQAAKCQILNDNGMSDAGYKIVIANFYTDNNTNLHICLGLVKTSSPTNLVNFTYTYCRIMRIAYGGDWTESVASDNETSYSHLIPAEFGKADSFSTSVNAGSANQPVYFNNGVPTVCNWWVS